MGLLAGKTRVLCTHHTQFLERATSILVFEAGQIVENGQYKELLKSGGILAQLSHRSELEMHPPTDSSKSLDMKNAFAHHLSNTGSPHTPHLDQTQAQNDHNMGGTDQKSTHIHTSPAASSFHSHSPSSRMDESVHSSYDSISMMADSPASSPSFNQNSTSVQPNSISAESSLSTGVLRDPYETTQHIIVDPVASPSESSVSTSVATPPSSSSTRPRTKSALAKTSRQPRAHRKKKKTVLFADLHPELSRTRESGDERMSFDSEGEGEAGSENGSDTDTETDGDENHNEDMETRAEGAVEWGVYAKYLRAVGYLLSFAIFMSLLLMQGSRNILDGWLTYWVRRDPDGDNTNFYLSVYALLGVLNSLFTLARSFLFAYGGIAAARVIHQHLLDIVLSAKLFFFETTPSGRIINRFSSDQYTVDDSLPFIFNIFLANLFGSLGSIIIACIVLPMVLAVLAVLSIIYYRTQQYYRHTSREVKRLDSVARAPVYSHIGQSLAGLHTIRAFGHQDRFVATLDERLDTNQRAAFTGMAVSQWLNIRMQSLGSCIVASVAVFAVYEHTRDGGGMDPGILGLSMSYTFALTPLLAGLLTSFIETEKEMVSVERMKQYDIVESEALDTPPVSAPGAIANYIVPPPMWPSYGHIKFLDVWLYYGDCLEPALRGVSFEIEPGEKVGVVGRTGSGKSSLLTALFRLEEASGTSLCIDGIDVRTVPLYTLRGGSVVIIPQVPALFSGTLRLNADPEDLYSDEEISHALSVCHVTSDPHSSSVNITDHNNNSNGHNGSNGNNPHGNNDNDFSSAENNRQNNGQNNGSNDLNNRINHHNDNSNGLSNGQNRNGSRPLALNTPVLPGGSNFSVGQRQLICLARAILRRPKVICLDEATANVDTHTEMLIQSTLQREFSHCTVITIAHRINTILNHNRVLVMDAGKVAEFGPPIELSRKENGIFANFLKETGVTLG
eukprot:TRINITY_DN740_c0_g1::TRINITY_DN740_c0_g1_i1::g.18463::m.18463 TRINITY_DN740_c0_g1::TRINITY_DN740_c0_g1_i1::g.18463  ORF type:complete len:1057 (-),score=166.15,sp/P32386/YBT1_YEAST/31.97/2e-105,sp/P32386/YBT1_YEAST/44.52/7e-28,sp/P32386/YBT1_YEAST/31.03/5e-06,ABC_membrane/PF00664.18/1.2e-37,ABC_tran/PF00005.22/2.1e-06,ABC_tran/PF00005.22/6e-21,SMC_N/PF02463.14/2.4,SMC_N/PF02463.14/0.14,SMC_N/PF02463.14/0.015,AAA_21/PF13304.1/0.00029,Miro/PF08477.8/0.009,AAA_16/PF13191.1/5.6e+03,AAA_16/PF13191.1/